MKQKITVGVLFGGKSVEHEVSLQSARNVIKEIDRNKYALTLIGIDKQGQWHFYDEESYLVDADDPETIELGAKLNSVDPLSHLQTIDVLFPVLHGPLGEDGTVQGLLKLADIPFVGAGVLGSSIGMDKDVMKRLLRDAHVPIADFLVLHEYERHLWPFEKVLKHLCLPFFVKPANAGSSIGISKVENVSEFEEACRNAFQYDRKILIEETIIGREFNCSLLGNEHPIISLPCEIIPKGKFHSYASKYLDPEGAEFIIPAEVTPEELSSLQTAALKAYKILCCEGMARVDLFLSRDGIVYVNEINTIPGLTNMSPYVKMWSVTGVEGAELMDRLIQLALKRKRKEKKLITQLALNLTNCEIGS